MNLSESKEEIIYKLGKDGFCEDFCVNYTHPAVVIEALKELGYKVSTSTLYENADKWDDTFSFLDNVVFYIFKEGEYTGHYLKTNLYYGTSYIV